MGIEFWKEKWASENTPWDLGGPHPLLPELTAKIEEFSPGSQRVFVPGCGAGHDAAAIAKEGDHVVGMDIVPQAIDVARKKYSNQPGLSFVAGDVLTVPEDERGRYTVVVNRTILCALPQNLWQAYIDACTERLTDKGLWSGVIMTRFKEPVEGPPFEITHQDLDRLFQANYEILFKESREGSVIPVAAEETLFIARKK